MEWILVVFFLFGDGSRDSKMVSDIPTYQECVDYQHEMATNPPHKADDFKIVGSMCVRADFVSGEDMETPAI